MLKTKLSKLVERLADELASAFRNAGLRDVASPNLTMITVSMQFHEYRLAFPVLAARGVRLRFTVAVGADLDCTAMTAAAVRTAEVVRRARASGDGMLDLLGAAADVAGRVFEEGKASGIPIDLIGVRPAPVRLDRDAEPIAIEICYEGLDNRLRPRRKSLCAVGLEDLVPALGPEIAKQRARAAHRRMAEDAGGIGLVEGVTLAVISAMCGDPSVFLRALAGRYLLLLDVSLGRGSQQSVQWRDGVAGMRLSAGGDPASARELTFGRGEVCLSWPDRGLDLQKLEGRPISDFVQHPILPMDLVIEQAHWDTGWPQLRRGPDDNWLNLTYIERLHAFDADGIVVN